MVVLTLANIEAVRYACTNYHYAERTPVSSVAFNVYEGDEWCGVIVYGYGACPYIASQFGKWPGQVLELVRVALNGTQETTSECVAIILKLLKKYCPLVDLVISYADETQGHRGVLYQATNWTYIGVSDSVEQGILVGGEVVHRRSVSSRYGTASISWLRENVSPNAKMIDGKPKHRYLFPLNRRMRKQVQGMAKPYPKEKHASVV